MEPSFHRLYISFLLFPIYLLYFGTHIFLLIFRLSILEWRGHRSYSLSLRIDS